MNAAIEQGAAPSGPVEVLDLRDRDAKTFRLPDNTYRSVFGRHVHYRDEAGRWQDVDLTFRPTGTGTWVADRHDVTVTADAAGVAAVDRHTDIGVRWHTPAPPAVAGRQATFTDQGLAWTYATRKSGIKLAATVAAPRGPRTYRFGYDLLGGSALTVDADGNLVGTGFTVPRAFAVGADEVTYEAGAWRIEDGAVAFDFDDSALPATAFPYELDPTTVFAVTASANDGAAYGRSATWPPSSEGSSTTGEVIQAAKTNEWEHPEPYMISNAVAKWNTSSIPDGANFSASTTPQVLIWADFVENSNLRSLTADWYTGSIGSAYSVTAETSALVSQSLLTFAAKSEGVIFLDNYAGVSKTGTTGLRFHISGGGPPGHKNRMGFASYDHTVMHEPQLVVDWAAPASPPTITSASDTPDPVVVGQAITFSVGWVDDDDTVRAVICKTNAVTASGTCSGGTWAAGAPSSNSPSQASYVPSSSDVGTNTYYAFACDSFNTCSSSIAGTFTVDNPPTITSASDSPDPANPGDTVTFSVGWSDPGDTVRAVICRSNAVSAGSCPGGAWAVGSLSGSSPSQATYTTSSADAGTNSYFAFACDSFDVCSSTSLSGTFTVTGDPGNVSADPPAQVRAMGDEAVVTITATKDDGSPAPAAPLTISRSGANPSEAEQAAANGAGLYEYRYRGGNLGLDVIHVANTSGDTAQVTVEWLPPSDGVSYPSDDCATGNVVSGYVGDTYVRVRTQSDPADPGKQWVCVVGQGANSHHGGRLVFGASPGSANPDVGVDTTQAAAESCLPIGQRVESGSFAGGNPFFIDVAPNPNGSTGAWACVRVASVFVRVRVTTHTPVTVNFLPDEPQPRLYGEEVMTGLYSGTCQADGGTRHLNLKVGDQLVALYTSEDGTQQDVCVRAGPQGARVRVDSGATPAPDYDIGASRDSSCPWELISIGGGGTQVYMVDPFDPELPAGVCVTAAGSTHRVTVTLGDGEGGEPVDVDQDPV